jgi:heme a synthase
MLRRPLRYQRQSVKFLYVASRQESPSDSRSFSTQAFSPRVEQVAASGVTFDGPAAGLSGYWRRSPGRALAAFGWATLAYSVAVILWGAYVRVTGSGAGCGNHWPLCDGLLIPRAQQVQTLIEFTHRMMSGIALLAMACLWIWTRLAVGKNQPARYAASAAALLIVSEGALGAMLVLFKHVSQDKSVARAVWLSLHSANTMLLLGAIARTVFWTSKPSCSLLPWSRPYAVRIATLLLIVIVGATGAVTALGDTLFPAASLRTAIAQDFSTGSYYLLRLRILHPVMALVTITSLWWVVASLRRSPSRTLQRLAAMVLTLILLQVTLGALNVVLLAPTWLQIVHLFVADVLWVAIVLLAAESLTRATAQYER